MDSLNTFEIKFVKDATKIELVIWNKDGKKETRTLNRKMQLIAAKGETIPNEEIYGAAISQFDKYGQRLLYISRRRDGDYSSEISFYDKKLFVKSLSCFIMPTNGEMFFATTENKYDEKNRLVEMLERKASRVGGKYFSEMRTVLEHRSYGIFEKSWDFSATIEKDGSQIVNRQHNIGGGRYSGRRYKYEPGKGVVERFDEFEDEESLGYVVKLKKQPAITYRIYKNSWKQPTVEQEQ